MDLATDRKYLYRFISSVKRIHLGLGDKMLINRLMEEYKLNTIDDIGEIITNHLIQFGYGSESKHLKEVHEQEVIWLRDFADYIYERFKDKS